MSNPPGFFSQYVTTARIASAQTGFLPSVTLAQWALETSYGGSVAFVGGWNFAGVSPTGVIARYPNQRTGLAHYISTAKQPTYTGVRQASTTWKAQCAALGNSPWAGSQYRGTTGAGAPGSLLVTLIQTYNLTQYDYGHVVDTAANASKSTTTAVREFQQAYPSVVGTPPVWFSTVRTDQVTIGGTGLDAIVGKATVAIEVVLAITKISSVNLVIDDPKRVVINHPVFSQASLLRFGGFTYELFTVSKQGSVVTASFIPFVVAALKKQTGAFTIQPGQLTRTEFAQLLVSDVAGATFVSPTETWLYAQDAGYAHTAKEQLSRGTKGAPLEDSWTALQRLANEIQWVCFESFNRIYFGPYQYLADQLPVFAPHEFTGGVSDISGDWTVGQPLSEITVTCTAGSWTPAPGECVAITGLGPFNGKWIVAGMTRKDITEPTIKVKLMQPLPSLPEPTTGGTLPAAGNGAQTFQSTGGATAASKALAFAKSKVGERYSEAPGTRLGPTSYDCSGLVYSAYMDVGIHIGGANHTTYTMWPTTAGTRVPPGIDNLLPGDLVFFGPSTKGTATHVGMVDTVNKANGTVTMVSADNPTRGIVLTTFAPTVGASWGTDVYMGATRPAP